MIIRNISISKRLSCGFGILGLLMVVLMVTGIVATSKINSMLERIAQGNDVKMQAAYEMKDGVKGVNLMVFSKLVSKDKAYLSKADEVLAASRQQYTQSLGVLDKLETSGKGKELVDAFKANIAKGREFNVKVTEAAKAGNTDEALSIFVDKVLPSSLELYLMGDELIRYQNEGIAAQAAEARSAFRKTVVFMVVLGLVALGSAVILTVSLTKSITAPIKETVSITKKLAEGNLNVDIAVDSEDEFGYQATALKTMVEKWRDIIGSVKQASDSVASAGTQLSASAGQMSKGAGQQAERAHQVATASEEMSQTVEDIARNASSIASTASQAAATAKDGGKTVEASVKEVKEIAATVEESAGHITSLSELSQKIGDIIGIINEIADQTNLLALNAAIEAARAGEHGRGFAVVADEVRKLAERTTGATSEVSGIIREIQNKVGSAVASIGQVSAKVDRGVDLSSKAGVELRTIVKTVEDLQQMVQQIATAIEEMSATSDTISKDIESISGISGDTSRSADNVLKASDELSQLGADLQGIARQFEI